MFGPEAVKASRRTAKGESRLAQPFVDMLLDVNFTETMQLEVRGSIASRSFTLRALNKLMPTLRRLLWNDSVYRDTETIINTKSVMYKLVRPDRWGWPTTSVADVDLAKLEHPNFQNVMALVSQRVSQRVPLEQSFAPPSVTWQSFVCKQVSQHLHYLCDYYDDPNVVVIHVPSEPPSSVAAAWSFRFPPDEILAKWSLAMCTVAAARAAIDLIVGANGEEGARLLCSMAVDSAAGKRFGKDDPWGTKYASIMGVVTVYDWLQELLGPVQDQQDGSTFTAWCKSHWLNFKHVADLAHQIKPGDAMPRHLLGEFWLRHIAMRGVSNQKGWELLIPIYKSEVMPVEEQQAFLTRNLTYIVLQFKNTVNKPSVPEAIGPPLAHAVGAGTTTALELFFDLRGHFDQQHKVEMRITAARSPLRQLRYQIQVVGLDSPTFPLL